MLSCPTPLCGHAPTPVVNTKYTLRLSSRHPLACAPGWGCCCGGLCVGELRLGLGFVCGSRGVGWRGKHRQRLRDGNAVETLDHLSRRTSTISRHTSPQAKGHVCRRASASPLLRPPSSSPHVLATLHFASLHARCMQPRLGPSRHARRRATKGARQETRKRGQHAQTKGLGLRVRK